MSRVIVVTDSNSGITQSEAKELGVVVMPMPFYINGQMFYEDIDLTQEQFYQKLKEGGEIKTSMPLVGDVTDKWDELLKEYDEIVYIPMSSGLSSSCETAYMLSQDYDGKVQVVNNQRISVTMRQSVLDAKMLAEQGKGAEEIKEILEKEKFEKLLPIAKKYGAMFILLPLSDAGLPKDINEKKEIIHTILARALELGMHKEDIVVDGLVATVGANKNAALETLETICYCKNELGLATVGGLSNISFGLPNRAFVNAAFVTMALQSGLTMAIANPSSDIMMNLAAASDLLLNKAGADLNYINRMAEFDAKKKLNL